MEYYNIWENENNNKFFQLQCYYHAKTELYDRTLTDLRSPYDKTEAYITNPKVKHMSNEYAFRLFKFASNIAKQFKLEGSISENKYHFSAEGWVDQYNWMKEHKMLDWVEQYEYC